MINIDSSSLANTSFCLFFFLRALRDALNVTLYRFIVGSFNLTSNERTGSLFPSLMIIPYIYLLFRVREFRESYYQYHVPKLITSVILITYLLENFFKLYIKGSHLDVNKIFCRILLLFTSIITISLSIDDKTSFLAQISLSLSHYRLFDLLCT